MSKKLSRLELYLMDKGPTKRAEKVLKANAARGKR